MTWRLVFSKHAQKDAKKLAQAGLKAKAEALLVILRENPVQNPPHSEKLVGDLAGSYSRRINIQHRLVYEVVEADRVVNPSYSRVPRLRGAEQPRAARFGVLVNTTGSKCSACGRTPSRRRGLTDGTTRRPSLARPVQSGVARSGSSGLGDLWDRSWSLRPRRSACHGGP